MTIDAEKPEAEEEEEESPFRSKAVDLLVSPEQLDQLMIVIKPKGWIALLGLLSLIVVILIWAFVGELPIEVIGEGIILTEDGLFTLSSTAEGVVASIPVSVGDWVTENSVVMRVINQELANQIQEKEKQIEEHKIQIQYAKESNNDEAVKKLQGDLDEATLELATLQKKPKTIDVLANQTGRLTEWQATVGQYVQLGASIGLGSFPLKKDQSLICHAYLPIQTGELVQAGMKAKIALEEIDPHKYGYLLGEVVFVTEFPISDADILQVLRNPQLITYLKQGAPAVFAVQIRPIVDPTTFSGYAWSSPEGPPQYVRAGSICRTWIITQTRTPVSYIFPSLFAPQETIDKENPNVLPANVQSQQVPPKAS